MTPDPFPSERRDGVIYTIATGRLFCSMPDFHAEAERLLARPILTHEFADKQTWADMREALEIELTEVPRA